MDAIANQCSDNLHEQAMEMLQRWKDRDGCTVTVDVTCEVLITVSCKQKLKKYLESMLCRRFTQTLIVKVSHSLLAE